MPFEFLSSLNSNPYFGAGFGLVGVGAGIAGLRKGLQVASIIFRRYYMTTLEVQSKDKSYMWLLQWIAEHGLKSNHTSVETTFEQSATGKINTKFDYVLSPGSHFLKYKGIWIKVERTREKQMIDMIHASPWESVLLTSLGRNRGLYNELLHESRQLALKAQEGQTLMFSAFGSEWRQLGYPRRKRPIESVILDRGIAKNILNDLKEFIGAQKWYMQRGIPYRRGYLLYGPPGCGKSSYITALAGQLDYSICTLNLSERGLSDDRLNYLLTVAPELSIILLEDIDAAFVSRDTDEEQTTAYQGLSRLTFSGLLNALDGVASTEGRIIFMTTNYIDRLDPALIRPGRIDVKQPITFMTDYQLQTMYQCFYPQASPGSSERFSQGASGKNISAAQVQALFLLYKNSPEEALSNIHLLSQV